MRTKIHANRMTDKYMQIVASQVGSLIDGSAVVKRVTIRDGQWRGRYDGQRVVLMTGNVWKVA